MKAVIHLVAGVAVLAGALALSEVEGQQLQKITINYPTRSGASWHLYLAKDGGYYKSTVSTSTCSSASTRPAWPC